MKKAVALLLIFGFLAIGPTPGLVTSVLSQEQPTDVELIIEELNFSRFKQNIGFLATFGDRQQGTERNINAGNWLDLQLRLAGYEVERHSYLFGGRYQDNIYVTKVGTERPEEMYIISAHFDGVGGGGAADDDGSGTSLVLEVARAFAHEQIETDVSIRFIFWNSEEVGQIGSRAYVDDRFVLQGDEVPPRSGIYPEPKWLGIIQHDMILFDHGLPPGPEQIPEADLDIEFQQNSLFSSDSRDLANVFFESNELNSTDYPAEIGSNMNHTDSVPFQNLTAAISVRENQRVSEIGFGSNPHWHEATDVYETYSEADYRLGFNALQMTVGAVAKLIGARYISEHADDPPDE